MNRFDSLVIRFELVSECFPSKFDSYWLMLEGCIGEKPDYGSFEFSDTRPNMMCDELDDIIGNS